MKHQLEAKTVKTISPPSGWERIDFRELWEYRDLFASLVVRDIKVMYAQTVLGFLWAILNPVVQIVMFTLVFGKIAKLYTDGIPYLLFVTVAVIPWSYMSHALTASSQSLVTGQGMLGKVYFPRMLFPIAPILSKMLDFLISLVLIAIVMIYYQIAPNANFIYLPLFLLEMILLPMAMGLWLSALAIRYRDVKFMLQFVIRMLMFTAPIVYSASTIPDVYRFLYSLNPLVSVIEGIRSSLLGLEMQWAFLIPGYIVTLVLLVTGALYFRRMERTFADVI